MGIQKRLLKVKTTNDKVLQAYLRLNNDQDDGIWYNEIDRNATIPPGTEITGKNIVPRSQFTGETVMDIILDTNHLDQPTGYIISLCFATEVGSNSKLYMGRVSSGTSPTWTQCADSPKTYENMKIQSVTSSFLLTDPPSPIKIVSRRDLVNNKDEDVIIERH